MTSNDLFRIEHPDAQTLPIVVDVPHAGERIPEEILEEMLVRDPTLKRDLDLYVDQIWAKAPELGATLVAANVSRYVVDLNRSERDVSPLTVEGGESIHEPGYYRERGVVWRTTTRGQLVLEEPLSQEAFEERIATYYRPYHEALAAEIEAVKEAFGYCILVDGHSMPSMGRVRHDDTGSKRADIVPGDVDGTACADDVTACVEEHFRGVGYTVATNDPYKGGWITRYYGRPAEDVHAIQIEINRDLYMNEKTFAIDEEGIERLAGACEGLLGRLAELEL